MSAPRDPLGGRLRIFGREISALGAEVAQVTGHEPGHVTLLLLDPAPDISDDEGALEGAENADRRVIDWLDDLILGSGNKIEGLMAARWHIKDMVLSQRIEG